MSCKAPSSPNRSEILWLRRASARGAEGCLCPGGKHGAEVAQATLCSEAAISPLQKAHTESTLFHGPSTPSMHRGGSGLQWAEGGLSAPAWLQRAQRRSSRASPCGVAAGLRACQPQ